MTGRSACCSLAGVRRSDEANDYVVLGRALDALDRLYDGDSGAVDVEAILRLAGMALSEPRLGAEIVAVSDRLVKGIRSALPGKLSGQNALSVTDLVRVPIAEAWAKLDS